MEPARDTNVVGAFALRAADALTEAAAAAARGAGATAPALVLLSDAPGCTVGWLADGLQLSHSGAVRLVDRLVREGLARRTTGSDARQVALHLSARGRARAKAILTARAAAVERMLAPLGAQERAQLTTLLERLLNATTAADPRQAWHTCRLCDVPTCVAPTCPVLDAVQAAAR